jgi:uncharacterized membrane protein
MRDPRGVYRDIAVPGAVFTEPYDSDEQGVIVGGYADAAGLNHGFLRDARGRYRTIDVPGAAVTLVLRLNDRGQLVGVYSAVNSFPPSPSRGFLLDKGGLTRIDVPGAVDTSTNGLNNLGEIVGGYIDRGGRIHGFLRDREGRYRTLDVPGATASGAFDINDRRQIVGAFERPTDGSSSTPPQSGARSTDQLMGAP